MPKILIVDDEFPLRMLLRDTLELEGFTVVEGACGQEAIDLAWDNTPDAAIIDIGLPDFNGWEVCRKLKADDRSKDLPIIVLTAASTGQVEASRRELGVKHCILKPYDPAEVVRRLQDVLRNG